MFRCLERISSRGDRFVGVISTSTAECAGLTTSLSSPVSSVERLLGVAQGFFFRGEAFVGVLNGFLLPPSSAVSFFEGVLNPTTSFSTSSLCFELEATLLLEEEGSLVDLDRAALTSPPTACQVS